MDRFWTYLGGVIGGYAVTEAPLQGLSVPGLEALLDVAGALSMVVFSGALIVRGVRTMIGK